MTNTGPDLAKLKRQLVIAYRIFAAHGVLDIEGHISARHPENPELMVMGRHTPASNHPPHNRHHLTDFFFGPPVTVGA